MVGRAWIYYCGLGSLIGALTACQPTVKVEVPDKPIVINLNVKVEQEIRVRVEKEVESLMKKNPELF